jgi:hypothetical protein
MSNEWAHDAARKGVPTEMNNLIHDGRVLADTHALALPGSDGTYRRCAVPAQLVQDRSGVAPARPRACQEAAVKRPRPRTTLQKNPFMTRGAVISGASSGPHRAWDPV